jgi:hypothetical protein
LPGVSSVPATCEPTMAQSAPAASGTEATLGVLAGLAALNLGLVGSLWAECRRIPGHGLT